ncbi:hypothetical protein ACLB2K_019874 [Fragaria x ananassa]
MGTIAQEAGVLKLVRPGRRVERYEVPVTAAEVMRRYPRHSITRPDIFEFPWILVKPEAILTPGRVFYIVPNRTIYQLLKSRENSDSDQSSPALPQQQQRECPKDQAQQQVSKKTSPSNKSDAGRTPKHQQHRRRLKHQFLNMSCATTTVCPTEEQDYDKEVRRAVQRVSSAPVLLDSKKTHEEPKRKPSSHSSKIENRKGKGKASFSSITSKLGDLKVTTSRQVPTLKSCIRKPDSARKLRQFIVRFELPDDYVERQTKAADYRMQYPDYKY